MGATAKQSPTVRISAAAYKTLREMSAKYGDSMQSVLDDAIEQYRRQRFFDELNAAYAAIEDDPEALAAELKERALWDATLMDGLDPNEVWTEADFVKEVEKHG